MSLETVDTPTSTDCVKPNTSINAIINSLSVSEPSLSHKDEALIQVLDKLPKKILDLLANHATTISSLDHYTSDDSIETITLSCVGIDDLTYSTHIPMFIMKCRSSLIKNSLEDTTSQTSQYTFDIPGKFTYPQETLDLIKSIVIHSSSAFKCDVHTLDYYSGAIEVANFLLMDEFVYNILSEGIEQLILKDKGGRDGILSVKYLVKILRITEIHPMIRKNITRVVSLINDCYNWTHVVPYPYKEDHSFIDILYLHDLAESFPAIQKICYKIIIRTPSPDIPKDMDPLTIFKYMRDIMLQHNIIYNENIVMRYIDILDQLHAKFTRPARTWIPVERQKTRIFKQSISNPDRIYNFLSHHMVSIQFELENALNTKKLTQLKVVDHEVLDKYPVNYNKQLGEYATYINIKK